VRSAANQYEIKDFASGTYVRRMTDALAVCHQKAGQADMA
jgi:hypothetical protein